MIADPGPHYDESAERKIREMIIHHANYAEKGDTFDPAGNYLCGTCNMRSEPHACTVVRGRINMDEMGCRRWAVGKPMRIHMGDKSDPASVGLSRVSSGGFGCRRCSYGIRAKAPDSEGRSLWCGDWGCHVKGLACCDEENQKGLVVIH